MAELQPQSSVETEEESGFAAKLDGLLNELVDLEVIIQYAGNKVGAGVSMRWDFWQKALNLPDNDEGFQFMFATKIRKDQGEPKLSVVGFKQNITVDDAFAADLPTELPLVFNTLQPRIMDVFGWQDYPNIALQGLHAFDSDTAAEAHKAGIPVSGSSNVKDLDLLFAMYSYPMHKCFLLHDRGFVVLGDSVADVQRTLNTKLAPFLRGPGSDGGADSPAAAEADEAAASGEKGAKPIGFLKRMFSSRTSSDGAATVAPAATPPLGATPVVSSLPASIPASMPCSPDDDEMLVLGMKVRQPPRGSSEFHKVPTFQTGIKPW